ncbi:MAG TPA: CpaD family pilus assembly protein [Brevundimonas sp.]|nr:CpaD family pilus assembly protein [Brevundimonas sp.]
MNRSRLNRLTCLAAGSAALGLSGCAASMAGDPAPLTPTGRYMLQVEPGLDRIALAVREDGLSGAQYAAVSDLAARFGAAGATYVRIEAPAGDDPVASAHAYAVGAALERAGVPAGRIRMAGYTAPDPRAPVLVGFETLRAHVPNCSLQPRTMTLSASNQSSANFGCAVTANMAAQITNPRDILGAQPMTPADSGRAAVVFNAYRRGQPSSTAQEPLVNGQISRAVD